MILGHDVSLIAHAVFHLWEVAVGIWLICSPSVIPRDFPAAPCRRSSGRSLSSGQSVNRAPRVPHPCETRQDYLFQTRRQRTNSFELRITGDGKER